MLRDDDENMLTDDELEEARQWAEEIGIGSDGAYIEVNLVAHLVTEVDRLRGRVAQLEDILAEQRRVMGERQPSLFLADDGDG
jgi:hypothetical protein